MGGLLLWTETAMMRNRQRSGRAAEFPCQSAVDRQNSAAGGVGQIGIKPLIYKGYPA